MSKFRHTLKALAGLSCILLALAMLRAGRLDFWAAAATVWLGAILLLAANPNSIPGLNRRIVLRRPRAEALPVNEIEPTAYSTENVPHGRHSRMRP